MIPPYHTDEVAEAVSERAREAGIPVRELIVLADLRMREWRVVAFLSEDFRIVVSLPFSTAQGIVLPADVASRFVEEAARR